MAEVHESTLKAAKIIADDLTIGKDGATNLKDGTFEKLMGAFELTKDDYKKVKDLDAATAAGLAKATADAALPIFKSNKELDTVSAELKTQGRDFFKVSIDRRAEFLNPKTKEKNTHFGIVNVQHNVVGTKKGQYGLIRQLVRDQYREALEK